MIISTCCHFVDYLKTIMKCILFYIDILSILTIAIPFLMEYPLAAKYYQFL